MELNATIFIQIFIFMSVLLWLSRWLFAPILRLFEEREQRIDGAKKEAIALNEEAEKRANDFDEQYKLAKDNARKTLTEAKQLMEKEHNQAIAKVRAVAREKILSAQQEIKEQEMKVREQLRSAGDVLSEDVVAALLKRSS